MKSSGGGVTREFRQVDLAHSHKYGLPAYGSGEKKKLSNVNQRPVFTDLSSAPDPDSQGIHFGGPGKASIQAYAASCADASRISSALLASPQSESLARAMTLDLEARCLRLQTPGDREIFDLIVEAEAAQTGADTIFFCLQGVLMALALISQAYSILAYWSRPGEIIEIAEKLEPVFSRAPFAIAQMCLVGASLRAFKAWDHVCAFDLYEDNFARIRSELAKECICLIK